MKNLPALPSWEAVDRIIVAALLEDIGPADITTQLTIDPSLTGEAGLVAREAGRICGLAVAQRVFASVEPRIRWEAVVGDGDEVVAGTILSLVRGPVAGMLSAERVALNLLQRMSGIATQTARYVQAVAGTGARIVDTRKTAPGLRVLDKYAVRCGGGYNHRFGLFDGVLIKDNHVAACGGIRSAVERAKAAPHTLKVEVEVDRIDQIEDALAGGADIILLDNMSIEEMREAADLIGGRAVVEASGGMTLETTRAAALAGVNVISVGALTHSVPVLDIGLDLDFGQRGRNDGATGEDD